MGRVVVAAELPTAGGDARENVLKHLIAASKYALENEPGVYRYMVCLPSDPNDTKTVWVIEEYADQAALESHMAAGPVTQLIEFMRDENPLEADPDIRSLSWLDGMHFVKPEIAQQKDCHIAFANITFQPRKREETLKYWQGIVDSSKQESGALMYGIAAEEGNGDSLFNVEVYESEKYLEDTHIKSAAVQEAMVKTEGQRKEVKVTGLKLHAGFLYKS